MNSLFIKNGVQFFIFDIPVITASTHSEINFLVLSTARETATVPVPLDLPTQTDVTILYRASAILGSLVMKYPASYTKVWARPSSSYMMTPAKTPNNGERSYVFKLLARYNKSPDPETQEPEITRLS
ncbi:hypothetical protein C0J52_14824 [Blattella germanica]|nr:hypothetical protein C0J52_14824 [Blattella germanica]